MQADRKSAFGGVVLVNKKIDESFAKLIIKNFYEVLVSPSFTKKALNILGIKNVEFFDLYVAKDLGDDSKSVTFRVTIQSKEKTLEEKDLEQLHKNILEKVSNKFKAKIRS